MEDLISFHSLCKTDGLEDSRPSEDVCGPKKARLSSAFDASMPRKQEIVSMKETVCGNSCAPKEVGVLDSVVVDLCSDTD